MTNDNINSSQSYYYGPHLKIGNLGGKLYQKSVRAEHRECMDILVVQDARLVKIGALNCCIAIHKNNIILCFK